MSGKVVSCKSSDVDVLAPALRDGIAAIQQEQKVAVEFPADVEKAAEAAAANPRLPETDRTDIEFITIDPASSMDLDQALHIERDGDGYLVHYAIADVAAFVTPGDAIDVEANHRGETLYGADSKIPLHPRAISEGAASLLPDQVRPAFLWTMKLDRTGEGTDVLLERALVKSREKLDYEGVQERLDSGDANAVILLLKEVGELRIAMEVERGGVSLPMPEQEIEIDGDTWRLEFRELLPVENWNAQISLLTGMGAADIMLRGKVGLLRTLPTPEKEAVTRLRRTARALGFDWQPHVDYPEFIRSLDPSRPSDAAMVVACTSLLRGASYLGFNGSVPEEHVHAALAAPYAHVTAPLRRLADRYALEICVALSAGVEVPSWAIEKLDGIAEIMQKSGRRAGAYENAILNLVEAATLAPRVGETFRGVVLEAAYDDVRKGDLMVRDPAIEAKVTGQASLPVGEEIEVVLAEADVATRVVRFTH